MSEKYIATPDEIVRAKWPHEIFLINLVFNHILVFASTFGVFSTFPLMVLIVPFTSFAITGYILFKARTIAASDETVFVKAHWALAHKRNSHFMWLLIVACCVMAGGLWLSSAMGWSKIATIALLGGVGLLPFMVSLLILIVLGNDAVHQAKSSKLPKGAVTSNSATTA
ncbi:MAG: hypothetical protein KJ572_02200 [Gammaproteobacteria bacterium]|nr:hypothetical protein [Sideroxydans sp.]MBU3902741.1 hypothetical protein [Gammaproteobacteria bacterium]MBU4045137.1 hypothetical protein [Gammaproteobacteria bacterium]